MGCGKRLAFSPQLLPIAIADKSRTRVEADAAGPPPNQAWKARFRAVVDRGDPPRRVTPIGEARRRLARARRKGMADRRQVVVRLIAIAGVGPARPVQRRATAQAVVGEGEGMPAEVRRAWAVLAIVDIGRHKPVRPLDARPVAGCVVAVGQGSLFSDYASGTKASSIAGQLDVH